MPKRGVADISGSPKGKRGSPVTSPSEKKTSKFDDSDDGKDTRRPSSSFSFDPERKRKQSQSTGGNDENIEKRILEDTIKGRDAEEMKHESIDRKSSIVERLREPIFKVDREDPIGFNSVQTEVFALLPKILKNVDSSPLIDELKEFLEVLNEDDPVCKKQSIDNLFREYMLEHLIKKSEPWMPMVSLSVALSKEGVASPSLPITLLADLVDLMGVEECELIFNYIEDRLALWQEPHFFNTCKNAVLRMCNDLLRRLSQTQNTIFCGRILIFLSAYFPFSERSGLNVMSEFNTDNVTVYKTTDCVDDGDDTLHRIEETEETLFEGMDIFIPELEKVVAQCQEQKKKHLNVDYSMYIKFSSLQDFLRNPNLCYNKTQWKIFTTYMVDLLQALESSKLILEQVSDIADMTKSLQSNSLTFASSSTSFPSSFYIPKLEDENQYFAKYLTNRRVLELEMSDPQFRRSFLVQILIVLQYLLHPVKFKPESFVLNDEQAQFINKTMERVHIILGQIKPGGTNFVENVKHILKREEIWNKWKNEGCPPIKKPIPPPVSVSTDPKLGKIVSTKSESKKSSLDLRDGIKIDEATLVTGESSLEFEEGMKTKPTKKIRGRLGLLLKNVVKNKKFSLGNSELNRLWNICPDNLAACRSKTRDFMPSIEAYFLEAMKELDQDPLTPFDPKREVKPKKILGNANFGWRGLRLLARRSPYFFQMVSGTPIHPLQNYLEFVLRKISADLDINLNTQPVEQLKVKVETTTEDNDVSQNASSAPVNGEVEQESEVVTASADDDEELSRPETGVEDDRKDGEEGEVENGIRNLSETEQNQLGRSLGSDWKKLGPKLGFSADEVDFFDSEQKENAASYMLRLWTEQEREEATVADLLYILEGLGLREKAEGIIAV